jgi:hypothetical protein
VARRGAADPARRESGAVGEAARERSREAGRSCGGGGAEGKMEVASGGTGDSFPAKKDGAGLRRYGLVVSALISNIRFSQKKKDPIWKGLAGVVKLEGGEEHGGAASLSRLRVIHPVFSQVRSWAHLFVFPNVRDENQIVPPPAFFLLAQLAFQ